MVPTRNLAAHFNRYLSEGNMDVINIVREYLIKNGYDGLLQPGECGCALEDLAPCGEIQESCIAGYKGPCTCGEGCDFDIYVKRSDSQAATPDAPEYPGGSGFYGQY
jgi:hypothetical protein